MATMRKPPWTWWTMGSLVPQEEEALLAQGRGRGQQAGPGQLCSEHL